MASGPQKRPLTQAEFLKLMQLLTTQRIIANGLAQLRFEEMWPRISMVPPDPGRRAPACDAPKLLELRELLAQVVLGSSSARSSSSASGVAC